MEDIAVLEYLDAKRQIVHVHDQSWRVYSTLDIKNILHAQNIKKVILITPFYLSQMESVDFLTAIKIQEFEQFSIMKYSTAALQTFNTKSIVFVYINYPEEDTESLTHPIEIEESKKTLSSNNFPVEGFFEFVIDGEFCSHYSQRIEGTFDDFTRQFYALLIDHHLPSEVLKNIYVFSRCKKFESMFRCRIALNVVSRGDMVHKKSYLLEVPYFISEINPLWSNVSTKNNGAVIGALKKQSEDDFYKNYKDVGRNSIWRFNTWFN